MNVGGNGDWRHDGGGSGNDDDDGKGDDDDDGGSSIDDMDDADSDGDDGWGMATGRVGIGLPAEEDDKNIDDVSS